MKKLRMFTFLLLLVLVAAACAEDAPVISEPGPADTATTGDAADTDTTEPAQGDAAAAAGVATVAVADTDLGEVLVAGDGKTLYLFDNDSGGESSCVDECAANWPPLTTDGDPVAGDGADAALLGTTERPDGTTQVTYNGHPLYHFAADSAPGDTTGQGVGGVWWAVTPAGEAVPDAAG